MQLFNFFSATKSCPSNDITSPKITVKKLPNYRICCFSDKVISNLSLQISYYLNEKFSRKDNNLHHYF